MTPPTPNTYDGLPQPLLTSLAELPAASTDFDPAIPLYLDGTTLTVPFAYYRDKEWYESNVVFHGVRAHVHRTESACTTWHLKAYDRLCLVIDSPWLTEVKTLSSRWTNSPTDMRHFLIYISDFGALEVIATDWQLAPELPTNPVMLAGSGYGAEAASKILIC